MDQSRRSSYLSLAAWAALLGGLVAYKAGALVAAVVLAAGAVGYLNAFGAFRAALAVVRRRRLSKLTVALVVVSAAGTVTLCVLGYWVLVALCTAAFLLVDAVALQFQGPPAGASAGEP